MRNNKIIILFLNFLKENNALRKYKKALLNDYKKDNITLTLAEKIYILSIEDIKKIINEKRYKMLIKGTFIWNVTQEGYYYWYNLDKKWIQILQKQYETTN